MCFSAEVSFGAAAVLAVIGGLSVRWAPTRAHVPFAATPLLFAVQQASEGIIWMQLEDAPFGVSETPVALVFLFFGLFLWPPYVPGSLVLIEPRPARRRWLLAFTGAGAMLGIYLMGCVTLRAFDACIAYGNIYYWIQLDGAVKSAVPFAYAATVGVALLLSSVRGTTALGAVAVASLGIVGAAYRAGFASVWCFVAAVVSGIVAVVVMGSRQGGTTRGSIAHTAQGAVGGQE